MGHGPRVFRKLKGAQEVHVLDALDRAEVHVRGELRVAEYGESFLQAELKPVAAGDPVARPVVKVLVGDDALDAQIGCVGGSVR